MKQYDVSVIIPVYNRTDELELTLSSLDNQNLDKSRFEVVIADDGSSEDVQGVLEQFNQLNVKYFHQEDLGFRVAATRNLGIQNASGRILVFNDNGILLSSDTLKKHIMIHKDREDIVLLGYMYGVDWRADMDAVRDILDNNGVNESIDIMEKKGGMGDGREGYMDRFGQDLSSWYIPWLGLWGGHFSVNSNYIKVNSIAFDENFTSWGGEDNDFGIQLCSVGAHYILSRDVKVVHYPTPNRANADIKSDDFKANYAKVTQYIAEKHNTEEVRLWQKLGSSANDPLKRQEYIKNSKHE